MLQESRHRIPQPLDWLHNPFAGRLRLAWDKSHKNTRSRVGTPVISKASRSPPNMPRGCRPASIPATSSLDGKALLYHDTSQCTTLPPTQARSQNEGRRSVALAHGELDHIHASCLQQMLSSGFRVCLIAARSALFRWRPWIRIVASIFRRTGGGACEITYYRHDRVGTSEK